MVDRILIVAAALIAASPVFGQSTAVVGTRAELQRVADVARPGLVIRIKPGRYDGGLSFAKLRGESDEPILICAADPKNPPVIVGGNECMHLINPAHVELRDLILEAPRGNALNIDDGGTMKQTAIGIKLTRIVVRDVQDAGNHDGIKLSGVKGFVIDSCTIERWGSGGSGIDMVGCADGAIYDTTLRHTSSTSASTGIQCKGGSRDVLIDGCRFENAGMRAINIGGSTGLDYFRPQPPQGYEAKDITVRRCQFIGSQAPIAFVGCDGALVHYNTIYRPAKWALRILQETTAEGFVPCRNGRFEKNLIVFRSDELSTAVNIGPNTDPKSFTFADNWWYCIDKPGSSTPALPVEESGGSVGENPGMLDGEGGDLRIKPVSPAGLIGAHALTAQRLSERDRAARVKR